LLKGFDHARYFTGLAEKAKAILNGGNRHGSPAKIRPAGRNATVEILYVAYDSAECKGAEVEVLLDLTLK
jgi:hypothetical protein